MGFDELNVMQQVDSLYADLDSQTRKKLKELWGARFLEVFLTLIADGFATEKPTDETISELLEMHLAGLLDEPNDVTHYEYVAEVLRKRDRAKEAILSVPTKAQKQLMMDKHLRYWTQMQNWYVDMTSQDAEITAMKEAGVERVQRHEQDDDKVCAVCRAADGTIYDIDKIPPMTHLNCRRWFTAYK